MHEMKNEILREKLQEFFKKEKSDSPKLPLEMIPVQSPIEDVVKLPAYTEQVEEGRHELVAQLEDAGVEIKTELTPFKSQELKSGIMYVLSEFAWILIYGIEVVEGIGKFDMHISYKPVLSSVIEGKYLLSSKAILVPEETSFEMPTIPMLTYKIVGEGYNNPVVIDTDEEYKMRQQKL